MAEKQFTEDEIRNIIEDYPRGRVKEISDADYAIGDQDDYDLFLFTSLSAARTLTLPNLSDHIGKRLSVMNLSGSFAVNITPSGSDQINGGATVSLSGQYTCKSLAGTTDYWVVLENLLDEDNMASNSNQHGATQQSIKAYVDAGTSLAESYDTGWIYREDWSNVHMGSVNITYDNLSGSFTVGATVTGGTSGTTGVIQSDSGSVLVVSDVTGDGNFDNNEQLTDDATGVTALVDGDTVNTDSSVKHDLGSNLSDLLIKVLVSTDGTENNSIELGFDESWTTTRDGITWYQVNTNELKVQTGLQGVKLVKDDGYIEQLYSLTWYYKIMVYKLK